MQHSLSHLFTSAIAALLAPAALFASPMISVDTVDANMGIIYEGKVTSIKHIFKVKNTGDSVLVIQSVKPG
jgi:hypothetical protein